MYKRIEKKIKWRVFQKIALLLLLAAGITVLLITSFKFCDLAEKIFSVLLSVVIYVFLFFKVKLIPLLRDTTWTGTVDSRACKKKMIFKGIARPHAEEHMYAYWKVHKDGGEDIILSYDTEDIADDYFHTGDRVRHFKGAKYIVLANPEEDNENLICPLCGKLVMKPECSFCRIDFSMPPEDKGIAS